MAQPRIPSRASWARFDPDCDQNPDPIKNHFLSLWRSGGAKRNASNLSVSWTQTGNGFQNENNLISPSKPFDLCNVPSMNTNLRNCAHLYSLDNCHLSYCTSRFWPSTITCTPTIKISAVTVINFNCCSAHHASLHISSSLICPYRTQISCLDFQGLPSFPMTSLPVNLSLPPYSPPLTSPPPYFLPSVDFLCQILYCKLLGVRDLSYSTPSKAPCMVIVL